MSAISGLAKRVEDSVSMIESRMDVKKNIRLAFLYYSDMTKIIEANEAEDDDFLLTADSFSLIVDAVQNAIMSDDSLELFVTALDKDGEIHKDFADEILGVAA